MRTSVQWELKSNSVFNEISAVTISDSTSEGEHNETMEDAIYI